MLAECGRCSLQSGLCGISFECMQNVSCPPQQTPLPQPRRVSKLPMDAPDHSWIDPEDVPAAFYKHFGKQQQRQQEGAAAQQQQQRAGGMDKGEL